MVPGTVDWNTLVVAAIAATPVTMYVLKLHRDLITKTVPAGFAGIVETLKSNQERADDRHEQHLLAMANLQHAIVVCRYGPKRGKHHRNASPFNASDKCKPAKGRSKKRPRGSKKRSPKS